VTGKAVPGQSRGVCSNANGVGYGRTPSGAQRASWSDARGGLRPRRSSSDRVEIQLLRELARIRLLLAGTALIVLLTAMTGCSASWPSSSSPTGPTRARPPEAGMWISRAEVEQLPMQGIAWENVKAAADGDLGAP
jgi:hypothetical protein